MPAGPNHAGRTREARTMITAPVSQQERARVERNAARKGLSIAEYVRRRCAGDTARERMVSAPWLLGELAALLEEVPSAGPAREHIERLIEMLG